VKSDSEHAKGTGAKEYRLSRISRLDFHGAIHIVHVRGRDGYNIFFDRAILALAGAQRRRGVPHLLRFLQLLDGCCSECGAQLFGYCVEPNECEFVLRNFGAPLEACMQRLGGRYSRYLHDESVLPKNVRPYATRYESKVLAPEYLPHALRRVHARPVQAGLVRRAIDYPFSSAAAYLGERALVQLESDAVWRALERKGLFGLRGYKEFMERAESPHVSELFERGARSDERVVGDRAFVVFARDAAGHPRAPPSREELIAGVAKVLGVSTEELYGHGHTAVVGRALVAWFALRYGSASLREVGMWFSVSGATIGQAVRHYRRLEHGLFGRKALPGIQVEGELEE
jgi:hypothetical protein